MNAPDFVDDDTDDLTDGLEQAVGADPERGYDAWIASLPPDRRALLQINHQALQDEFIAATSKFAWWFEGYAAAEDAWLRAKAAAKVARAQALVDAITDLNEDEKAPAKHVLDAMIELDVHVRKADEREHEARREYRRWQGDIEALRQRRDYLVQLGARTRVEMIQEPKINEQQTRQEKRTTQ